MYISALLLSKGITSSYVRLAGAVMPGRYAGLALPNAVVVVYNINTHILYYYSIIASTTITTTPATNHCNFHLC